MSDPQSARQPNPAAQVSRPLALVVCGALVKEVRQIAISRGWSADYFGIPARHHTQPRRILESVESILDDLEERYEQVVVVYGDCGTAGALDRLLEKRGVRRIPGPHCYEMYAGADFPVLTEDHAGTYFVTDYLVRHWETTVLADTDPRWRDSYTSTMFAGFERMVYLQQEPDVVAETKAREIAGSVGLPLEVRPVGLGALEERLIEVVEGNGQTRSTRG